MLRRILLLLFSLSCAASAFGQAYSSSVTQNSPGNYGRPVPYAQVLVCALTDNNVPCVTKAATYTDYTLGTACSQNGISGVLVGGPTSGANCNNPGIADANGNFTIYVATGQYTICTFAQNWLCQKVSIGTSTSAGFTFSCPSALNGSLAATTTPTNVSCDPLMGTDFSGNGFSQSWATLGAFNGFYQLKGGAADPGTAAKFLMPANTVRLLAPQTTTAPYSARLPSTPCAVGQVWNVTGVTTDGNGQEVDAYGCLTPGGNVSITATSPIVVTPSPITGTGVISCPTCNTGSTGSALNPSAPTVTPKGTTGATTDTYLVVGCEDVNCTKTSQASATGTTSTANATLSNTNFNQLTAYADTLYGYRFFKVCRTVAGGTPNTTGVIATGVGKSFNDTGLSGDGSNCATTYSTNNTVLDQHCLGAALPAGLNVIPGTPCGVDAPPTSPNALDAEFTNTFGAPGDVNNPFWQQLNWGTSTASFSGGELIFAPQNTAGNDVRMLGTTATMPAAPWEFEMAFIPQLNFVTSGSVQSGMCLYDGSKSVVFFTDSRAAQGMEVMNLTGLTTFSSTVASTAYIAYPGWVYMKIKNDGTNLIYTWSWDGVNFLQVASTLKGAWLGTITSIGPCQLTTTAGNTMDVDFFRRTQ